MPSIQYDPKEDFYQKINDFLSDKDQDEIGNISPDASAADFKRLKRKINRKYHPDTGNPPEWIGEFNGIIDELTDPEKKAMYDRERRLSSDPENLEDIFERVFENGFQEDVVYERPFVPPNDTPNYGSPESGFTPEVELDGKTVQWRDNKFFVNGIEIPFREYTWIQGAMTIDASRSPERGVIIDNGVPSVNLDYHDGNDVKLRGFAKDTPEIRDGYLHLKDFVGHISMPKNNPHLTINAKAEYMSNISGKVIHPGRLEAQTGEINISIESPLEVVMEELFSVFTQDRVVGMIYDDNGKYSPPGKEPIGELKIKTVTGKVKIKYDDKTNSPSSSVIAL
tara:strand:+ start:622 stop:1635 length:1014 start_codon:yes stop_codon:yes gene_type:complete